MADKKKGALIGLGVIAGVAGVILIVKSAKAAPPIPHENIIVTGLGIEPTQVYVGQPVQISVTVTNIGSIAGSYEVTCEVI